MSSEVVAPEAALEPGAGLEPDVASSPQAMPLTRRQQVLRIGGAIVFVLAVSLVAILFSDHIKNLDRLGYVGVFLVSLLACATVIFPAPGLAVTFAMGSALSPLLVGLAAGLGETIGEFSGYIAGRAGRSAFGQDPRYERLERATRKYGGWAVLVLSVLPLGLFDLVGIAAGAMRMPLARFVAFTWVGKTVKTIIIAYAGSLSLTWLLQLIG